MIFILCAVIVIIVVGVIVAIIRADRPAKLILNEVKYEIIYNIMGSKSLLEDMLMKRKNVTDLPLKSGNVAVITGGSRGIGAEVVKMLMQCDIHVVIGCRNISSGETLLTKIRKEVKTGDLKIFKLDTSSLHSVKLFAKNVKELYPKVHILINNAGIMFGPYVETADGYESQFITNYLGHFLLTHLLLQQLKAAGDDSLKARIVNVSSCAYATGNINFEDINNKSEYIPAAAYAQSKLALVVFTNYLNTVLKDEGSPVECFSVHPGIVNTDLFNGTHLKRIAPFLIPMLFKTPAQGATPIVYASVSEKIKGKGGSYISNCQIMPITDISNTDLQKKLFDFTKHLLSIDIFGKA